MKKCVFIALLALQACDGPNSLRPESELAARGPAPAPDDDDAAELAHARELLRDPAMAAEAARVQVLESEHVGRATEVLGVVDVHEPSGRQDLALQELRALAAERHAEAVVGVEFHHGESGAPTHLSGMAVRFRNLLRDEPYDVLGSLDVATDMEHEGEAFGALRRRGSALHADLIIDITYVHGEGEGEAVHLRGTPIRYRHRPSADSLP